MTYTKDNIRNMFQSSFDLTEWNTFIKKFFKANEGIQLNPTPSQYIDVKDGIGYELGYLNTLDDYRIGFFYLKLNSSVVNRRVSLCQMISKYIKIDADAGIGVFDDGKHWRLSFITDLKGEKTSPKRYSFVFGDSTNLYRTAVDRFVDLQNKGVSFKNIKEAFSVEALTKQFYNDLFDWYQWALKDDTGVYFPENKSLSDEDKKKAPATRMIRLITRLMFVWFIKQKGLVPEALFNPEEIQHWLKEFDPHSMQSGNYYQAILQNLFFATLNRPIKTPIFDKNGNQTGEEPRRFAKLQGKHDVKNSYRYEELFKISKDKILSIFEFIPFINGGLFECLDKDMTQDGKEAYWEDGFTRSITTDKNGRFVNRAFVPNKLFFDPEDGLISIFSRYNFTVEENSPSEQQVALDPELLGKIFENLLGVYNPETHDTARNESGSFYTPREIVNYMVDRSLETYLGNSEDVKELFCEEFEYKDEKKVFYNEIIEKLKIIKVLDPACGSGAFPMGMLNRIIEIMQNLKAEENRYNLKLQIMEDCIYGGDIQAIAAQITKLRFFISLICDCDKTNDPNDNYGIPNLPNLETHFVTCDSLISLKKTNTPTLFEQDIIELKNQLCEVRHEHFTAKSVYQKNKLRNRDKELRNKLTDLLKNNNAIEGKDAIQMANWNPYDQNAQASFFDPEWMFGFSEFDIVIGNPPYIRLQNNEGMLADKYESCKYSVFERTGDIYCLFYEMGYNHLKNKGTLCYITSNKWMRAGYGKKTRQFFTTKTNCQLLIDLASVQIFEGATVDTNIILFTKEKVKVTMTNCVSFTKKDKNEVKNLSVFVLTNQRPYLFSGDSIWNILDQTGYDIKTKIETKGKRLIDWKVIVNRGVVTGNKVFIIDGNIRNKILAACSTEEEKKSTENIIVPMLRGKDVFRYNYRHADKYIIGFFPARNYNIEDYPALKKYLLSFAYDELVESGNTEIANNHLEDFCKQKLQQTGTYVEIEGHKIVISGKAQKSRKRTNNKWFETQDSICYWNEFNKPKVMWKIIGCNINFTLDNSGIICNNAVNIMTGKDDQMLQFVGLMNSKLFDWYLKITTEAEVQGGGVQLYATTLEKTFVKLDFPVSFSNMVRKRINGDISDDEMDATVFNAYGLTDDEITYILNSEEVNRAPVNEESDNDDE